MSPPGAPGPSRRRRARRGGERSTPSRPPVRSSEPTLRQLEGAADYAACLALQREIWGRDFSERVPLSLLMVARKTGGVVAGAFDPEGRMLGFVFGITGPDETGELRHWSHMLAVRREARGRGIGLRLKRYQRDLLLGLGVREALWSFDPLVARNAHLNLRRLGAEAVEYVVDMYGRDTGSPLHGGAGTDRLIVRWELASDRVRRALEGEGPPPHPEVAEPERAAVGSNRSPPLPAALEADQAGAPRLADPRPEGPAVRLEVPPAFPRLVAERPETAAEWRRASRRAFLAALEGGYRVAGFVRTPPEPPGEAGDDTGERRGASAEAAGGWYVLRREPD